MRRYPRAGADFRQNSRSTSLGFSDRKAVEYLPAFLEGSAGRWFMDTVAMNPSNFTLKDVTMGLFAQFFPPDLKAQQRRRFTNARQGEMKFNEYIRELRRLQRRIPDITDRQICVKLWDTVQPYLKVKWIEAGVDAEVDTLEHMCETAERFEAAENIRRRAHALNEQHEHHMFRYMSQHGGLIWQRTNSPYTLTHQPSSPLLPHQSITPLFESTRPNPPSLSQNTSEVETSHSNGSRSQGHRSSKPKMSQEERNELRAANKCFACKETGHTARDCPSPKMAKTSETYIAALQPVYDMIEELRKQREIANIPVASIRPIVAHETDTNTDTEDESDDSETPYSMLDVEVPHAGLLLNEILEEITPYEEIVVTNNDRFRITSNDLVSIETADAEITQQVREAYLAQEQPSWQTETENIQGPMPSTEAEESVLTDSDWVIPRSESEDEETQRPIARPNTRPNAADLVPETYGNNLCAQLYALRVGGKKRIEQTMQATEQNAARPRDATQKLPKPDIVEASINGEKVGALLDSGSPSDFVSTTVADQLMPKCQALVKPIGIQMAATGSKSSINYVVEERFSYQGIDEMLRFNVINIDNYDMILGNLFFSQYKALVSVNPPAIHIGTNKALPIPRELTVVIESFAAELFEEQIEKQRQTRWMENISEFDIDVKCIPGKPNVLADALSRDYSNEPAGVVRHPTEYATDPNHDVPHILVESISQDNRSIKPLTGPLYVGNEIKAKLEARQVEADAPRRSQREQVEKYLNQPQRHKPRTKMEYIPDEGAKGELDKTIESPEVAKIEPQGKEEIAEPDEQAQKPSRRKPKTELEFESTLT
ncbi:Pol polyprotein/retrotransposon [Ceratobasidium sp. AG-Ba]|nr:Pol polyprotein/retrotransposon [Ceratobasidium sp. AG-Ba]